MKLTDKAEIDFQIFALKYFRKERLDYNKFSDEQVLGKLKRLSDTCKNALIVEFFDNASFKIIIIPTMFVDDWGCDIFAWTECLVKGLDSRQEAINTAIIKANELYNGVL